MQRNGLQTGVVGRTAIGIANLQLGDTCLRKLDKDVAGALAGCRKVAALNRIGAGQNIRRTGQKRGGINDNAVRQCGNRHDVYERTVGVNVENGERQVFHAAGELGQINRDIHKPINGAIGIVGGNDQRVLRRYKTTVVGAVGQTRRQRALIVQTRRVAAEGHGDVATVNRIGL